MLTNLGKISTETRGGLGYITDNNGGKQSKACVVQPSQEVLSCAASSTDPNKTGSFRSDCDELITCPTP